MTSWWTDQTSFARYVCSRGHQISHDRIPSGDNRPVLESLNRYEVLST